MDISKIGENIDAIRKMRGWSKAELARRTGLSQILVGRHILDNGKCMRLETAVKYAEALGCTLDDLTGDAIDPLKFECKTDIVNLYPYNVAVATLFNVYTPTEKERLDAAYSVYVPGLLKAMEHLTEKEQKVLTLRYKHDFTLDDVAAEFNVTRERARQIENKALRIIGSAGERQLWDFEYIKYETARVARVEYLKHLKIDFANAGADADVRIDVLGLSTRSYNCLRRSGIDTLTKLSEMTYDDFMNVRNIGRKSLEEIIEKAREYGITFKWEGEANDQN